MALTKSLVALLLVGGLALAGCADQVPPTASGFGSVLGPSTPPSGTGSRSPSEPSAMPSPSTTSSPGPPGPTSPPPPAATPGSTPTPTATSTPTPAPPLSEFPQSWAGTWQDPITGGSGALELTLTGRGSAFGGTITMDGTACLSNGILTGTYDGRAIEFSVGQRDVEIRFTGAADGASMAGTFVTDCDAMEGTWQVSRTAR